MSIFRVHVVSSTHELEQVEFTARHGQGSNSNSILKFVSRCLKLESRPIQYGKLSHLVLSTHALEKVKLTKQADKEVDDDETDRKLWQQEPRSAQNNRGDRRHHHQASLTDNLVTNLQTLTQQPHVNASRSYASIRKAATSGR